MLGRCGAAVADERAAHKRLPFRPAEGATPRTLALSDPVGQLALRYNEQGVMRRTRTQGPKDGPPHSTQQYKMTARMVAALGAFGSVLVVYLHTAHRAGHGA